MHISKIFVWPLFLMAMVYAYTPDLRPFSMPGAPSGVDSINATAVVQDTVYSLLGNWEKKWDLWAYHPQKGSWLVQDLPDTVNSTIWGGGMQGGQYLILQYYGYADYKYFVKVADSLVESPMPLLMDVPTMGDWVLAPNGDSIWIWNPKTGEQGYLHLEGYTLNLLLKPENWDGSTISMIARGSYLTGNMTDAIVQIFLNAQGRPEIKKLVGGSYDLYRIKEFTLLAGKVVYVVSIQATSYWSDDRIYMCDYLNPPMVGSCAQALPKVDVGADGIHYLSGLTTVGDQVIYRLQSQDTVTKVYSPAVEYVQAVSKNAPPIVLDISASYTSGYTHSIGEQAYFQNSDDFWITDGTAEGSEWLEKIVTPQYAEATPGLQWFAALLNRGSSAQLLYTDGTANGTKYLTYAPYDGASLVSIIPNTQSQLLWPYHGAILFKMGGHYFVDDTIAPQLHATTSTSGPEDQTLVVKMSWSDNIYTASSLTVTNIHTPTELFPEDSVECNLSADSLICTFHPLANSFGVDSLEISLSDGVNTLDTVLLVSIVSVNDQPKVKVPIVDQEMMAGDTLPLMPLKARFTDVESSNLTFTVNGNLIVLAEVKSGALEIIAPKGSQGVDTVLVRATDELGGWVEDTIQIVVKSSSVLSNQLPTFAQENRSYLQVHPTPVGYTIYSRIPLESLEAYSIPDGRRIMVMGAGSVYQVWASPMSHIAFRGKDRQGHEFAETK